MVVPVRLAVISTRLVSKSDEGCVLFSGRETLEIYNPDFPRRFERLIALVQVRSVYETSGPVLKGSSASVDMAEEMDPRLLPLDRIE